MLAVLGDMDHWGFLGPGYRVEAAGSRNDCGWAGAPLGLISPDGRFESVIRYLGGGEDGIAAWAARG